MRSRRLIPFVAILVFVGGGTLYQTLTRTQLEGVRAVDIVSLTGSGFCLGVAFAFLILTMTGQIRSR